MREVWELTGTSACYDGHNTIHLKNILDVKHFDRYVRIVLEDVIIPQELKLECQANFGGKMRG